MWRSVLLAAILPFALGLGACGDGEDSDTDRLSTATELADTWGTAWDTNNPEMIASVFTDDGQYVSFDGNTYEGDEIADHVLVMGDAVTNLVRTAELTETAEGTFTWVVEADLGEVRHRGTPEMELDGNLMYRLTWAEDPVPID
jgi:hypothetical protein